jgi:hypothetical protein
VLTYLSGPGKDATLIAVVLVCFFGGVSLVWQQVRPHVEAGRQFVFAPENVVTSPQPNWIKRDVRGETLRAAHLDEETSLLEPDLAERLTKEFRLHPWVAQAQVRLDPSGKVNVELAYRRPAVVVATVAGNSIPVDDQGFALPIKDFTPDELKALPLVWNIQTSHSAEGTQWKDSRVLGAVKIASLLGKQTDLPHIAEIRPTTQKLRRLKDEITYELHTAERMMIEWGSPPGEERSDEMSAKEKLAQLRSYLVDHAAGPTEIVKLSDQRLRVIPVNAHPEVTSPQ